MKLLGTYRGELDIRKAVLDMAQKKKQIIHGARAVNKQLPPHLRRKTVDYDVYTKNPEGSAKQLAIQLNKEFGNGFTVEKGIHKGTFRVKKNGEVVADYTQVTKHPSSVNKFGIKYAKTGYAKRKLQKLIRDETKEFRREKDIRTIEKIKQAEMNFNF